jgi:hypothetical protein
MTQHLLELGDTTQFSLAEQSPMQQTRLAWELMSVIVEQVDGARSQGPLS